MPELEASDFQRQHEECSRDLACENLQNLNNYVFIISYSCKGLCVHIYEVIGVSFLNMSVHVEKNIR